MSTDEMKMQQLWRDQPREEQTVVSTDIRARAERLDMKTSRWRVVTTTVFVLLLGAESWQVWRQPALLERAGDLLTMAALAYVWYRFRQNRMAAPPVALGRTNCVEFYRNELMRQRDLSNDSWSYLPPFVPGVTLALLGRSLENRPASQLMALVAFGVALFLGVAWLNAHTVRKLQRELDRLEAS